MGNPAEEEKVVEVNENEDETAEKLEDAKEPALIEATVEEIDLATEIPKVEVLLKQNFPN